jgi:hypothetical protein
MEHLGIGQERIGVEGENHGRLIESELEVDVSPGGGPQAGEAVLVADRLIGRPCRLRIAGAKFGSQTRKGRRGERFAWLAAANRYQLRKISLETGVPLRQVDVIRSHWFAEWDSAGMWALGVAPRPSSIVSVREDNEGLLWVLGSRSAAGWTPTPRPSTPDFEVRAAAGVAGREIGEWQAAINAKLESVVDVIDPTSGSLLGSLKLPGNLHQLTSELYYTTREIATSEVVVTVFRITLRRQ